MSPFIAEIIGTFFLILFGGGVVANVVLTGTKGNNSGWIVITFGWGFAVFTGVAVAGAYSGAHLNPAVSIGLAVAGLFPWGEVAPYIVAQLIGAMLGALGVFICYQRHFEATEDQGLKLAVFSTGPAIRDIKNNFVNEVIGTFALVFVILYLSGPTLTADGLENVQIGLGTLGAWPVAVLVTAIGLSLGGTTGYAINPARDLGPRIMHAILPIKDKGSSDWEYSWVPVLAPIVGCIIAALTWKALG